MRTRRRPRGVSLARVRKIVERATGSIVTHRVRMIGVDISTLDTNAVIKTLLTADDDPNYDLTSDGTNIAECHSKSKIIKIDLKLVYTSLASATFLETALYKDPDGYGIFTTADGTIATGLWTSDLSATTELARKHTISYHFIRGSSGSDRLVQRIRIRRKALKRNSILHDGDLLKIVFDGATDTAAAVDIVGRIWTRHA